MKGPVLGSGRTGAFIKGSGSWGGRWESWSPAGCLSTSTQLPNDGLLHEKGPTPPALGLPLCVGLSFHASGTMGALFLKCVCVTWHLASNTVGPVLGEGTGSFHGGTEEST